MNKLIPAILLAAMCSLGAANSAMALDDTWDSWSAIDNTWWDTDVWGTDDYGYYDSDFDWDVADDDWDTWYSDYDDTSRTYDDVGDDGWFDV